MALLLIRLFCFASLHGFKMMWDVYAFFQRLKPNVGLKGAKCFCDPDGSTISLQLSQFWSGLFKSCLSDEWMCT